MIANIPETSDPRIVIIGAGFAGLKFARKLINKPYQVVLIDKFNYHQFQPLMYQVATAGLEPSSISFPLRKIFQKSKNVHIRNDEVLGVDTEHNRLNMKTLGHINYDYLVIAHGADTNYFGNKNMEKYAIPMKSVPEALALRNLILRDYEKAISETDYDERQALLDIVIVGGGATGVEIAGALADMKKYILPRDFKEINAQEIDIYLIDSNDKLLATMDEKSSISAEKNLKEMGVNVITKMLVKDYDGKEVIFSNGEKIRTNKVIWAAGIQGRTLPGLPTEAYGRGRRIIVDDLNKVNGYENIYAIGDCAIVQSPTSQGHPQVAQVALQQAENLANNFLNLLKNKPLKSFQYKDLGSMATIGRKRAVVEVAKLKFSGFFAWLTWLFVHLMAIVGTKNRLFIFINWMWSYITRDQSLRLIIKPADEKFEENEKELNLNHQVANESEKVNRYL